MPTENVGHMHSGICSSYFAWNPPFHISPAKISGGRVAGCKRHNVNMSQLVDNHFYEVATT